MTAISPERSSATWCLSECAPSDAPPREFALHTFPFSIGRVPESSLCLPVSNVSKQHAEIDLCSNRLIVRDLGSTNGTFVNNRRVADSEPLDEGDLLQFATEVFRVQRRSGAALERTVSQSCEVTASLCQFARLLTERAVIPHFQPIVALVDGRLAGFECLARTAFPDLQTPRAMFQAAQRLGKEVPLSTMLRHEAVGAGRQLPGQPMLFLNTHPKELGAPDLLATLPAIRALAPQQPITIEVHEGAAADEQWFLELRDAVHALGMQLAYDDFGAGQARLDELARVAPDYVKFDMRLVRDLHHATTERRLVTARLVELVRELDIVPLAEGVERAEEAEACREVGFELAQGYLFGQALPLAQAATLCQDT